MPEPHRRRRRRVARGSLHLPADGFVEQANDQLPGLPLVGGLASSGGGAGATRLFRDGRSSNRGAVGVVLSTTPDTQHPVAVSTIVSQGTRPIGPAMTVTGAEGNLLLGLAPALEKVREIVATLPAHDQEPRSPDCRSASRWTSTPMSTAAGTSSCGLLGADLSRGGVAIGDIVEVGRRFGCRCAMPRQHDADLAALLRHFREAEALDPVEGALLFSAMGVVPHCSLSPDHDVAAVRRVLGAPPVSGFFAAGEVGPVGGRNHLHGFSASILAFGQSP